MTCYGISLLWATPPAPLRPTLQIDRPQPDQQLGCLEPSTTLPHIARALQVELQPLAGSAPRPASGGRPHAPVSRALLGWCAAQPRPDGLVCYEFPQDACSQVTASICVSFSGVPEKERTMTLLRKGICKVMFPGAVGARR